MTENQRTLASNAIIEAKGTFSNRNVRMEICPADVNYGIAFEVSLDGKSAIIPARIENVIEAENRSVIADRNDPDLRVNITEHMLSAMYGAGVDNALVRVNAAEIPLIDGSCLPYLLAIEKAGLIEQDAERDEIWIKDPIFIDDDGLIIALPHDGLKISYYLDHEAALIGRRIASIEVTRENFRERIAPARTYFQANKVPSMIAVGEVKNTDLSQVLMVYEDKVSQPLRFANEFCYHKILDVLGDLYLIGRRIRGHVIGIKSGHKQNRALAKKIAELYL